jgi:hypothetical protein
LVREVLQQLVDRFDQVGVADRGGGGEAVVEYLPGVVGVAAAASSWARGIPITAMPSGRWSWRTMLNDSTRRGKADS